MEALSLRAKLEPIIREATERDNELRTLIQELRVQIVERDVQVSTLAAENMILKGQLRSIYQDHNVEVIEFEPDAGLTDNLGAEKH